MEKVEQVSKWMSSDDQSGSSQTRCYSCTFCKRGFSNAQALGGHMNIHRRDRARIRQQLSEENQLSNSEAAAAAILKTTTLVDPDNKAPFQLEQLSQLQQISHITNSSFSLVIKDNEQHIMSTTTADKIGMTSIYQEQFEQLPLFDEEAPISEAMKVGDHFDENVTEELDLELRLGRESRRDTSLTLSTREFF